ncbi:MAG: outer membrane beta-barrel protein [Myxococcota bacterium]
MRKRIVCTAIVVGLALAPVVSFADDVQDQQQQMQALQDRMSSLEDQLGAANDVVSRQQEIIDRSGIADDQSASSGVAAFFDSLEMGGWLAGSYNYNFNDPNGEILGGSNQGATGFAHPFHGDSNSFQVDQLWMEMERPVTESQRAGFRADFVYGKTAEVLNKPGSSSNQSGSFEQYNLYQAYIQYLAPVGEGVTLKFGKMATPIGAEVAPTVYNWNVTRGNVYNLLQPINWVGISAEAELGEGFSLLLGYGNENVADLDVDLNRNKAVIGSLGWSGETVGVTLSGTWGSTNGALLATNGGVYAPPCTPLASTGQCTQGSLESDKEIIGDLVVTWDPTADLSLWVDGTWRRVDLNDAGSFAGSTAKSFFRGSQVSAWGVAAAGRYAVNDRMGVAVRAEYLDDQDSFFTGLAVPGAFTTAGSLAPAGDSTKLYSLTGTVDYSLTEQLVVRGEVRYDLADIDTGNSGLPAGYSRDEVFIGSKAGKLEDDQLTAGVEVIYNF